MRSLASLEVKQEMYRNLLCPVSMNRIPSGLQLIVSRKVPRAKWKVKTLMSAIEEEMSSEKDYASPGLPGKTRTKPLQLLQLQ